MDLLYSILVLFALALIWTGAIFLLFRKIIGHQIKKDTRMLLGGLFLFIAMIAIVFAGTAAFEFIESPEFCGTFCHIMEPYYKTYRDPEINSIMTVHLSYDEGCSNCHEGPGLVGKIEGLLRSIPEVYLYYTNTYNPDDLGGDVTREMCLKCHDGSISIDPRYVQTVAGTLINPHDTEDRCTECHYMHNKGLGLQEDTCSLCHGIDIDDFESMLEKHGERTGKDCMECHNRYHPDEALISFLEYPEIINTDFCSDCHKVDFDRLKSGEHESDDCFECHNEHDTLSINFNFCLDSCHTLATGHDETTSSCSVCHDLSTIHLEPGFDSGILYSEIICSNCHIAESTAYDLTYTQEAFEIYGSNGCIDCHIEHEAITYPHQIIKPYDDCGICHSTYNKEETIHDRSDISYVNFLDITKSFCSDCHIDQYTRFSRELHNSLECVECHTEHKILMIDFNKCSSCHDSPSDHDTSMTTCSDSECHEQLRSIHSIK